MGQSVLRVGCPMWAHRGWVGRYLPADRRGHELADYAAWCNAVEGNTTFYAVPAPAVVERWAEQAPPDFRFAFKAPRTVSHDRRLHRDAHRVLAEFLRALDPLAERVGPIQLQMPPSFGPDDVPTLRDFVVGLPRSHRWAVELRHPAFFDGGPVHHDVDRMLIDADVGRVVLDTRPLHAAPAVTEAALDERRTKPRLPVVTDVMGPAPIVRVIGSDDLDVTRAGLEAWVPVVAEWIGRGLEPYVFADRPLNLESPDLARAFHRSVGDVVAGLAPLPDPPSLPEQAALF